MVICLNNQIIEARASISFGSTSFATPYIQAISVSRERGTPQSKASVTINVDSADVVTAGDFLRITFFGITVFTGVVRRIQLSPANNCIAKFFLTAQAEDLLYLLENRRITRRQKLEGLGPMAIISSKVDVPERGFDPAPTSEFTFDVSRHSVFGDDEGTQIPGKTTNPRELTALMDLPNTDTYASNHPIEKVSRKLTENTKSPGSGGTGITIHDHSDLANLGPAHAVYGTK